MTRYIRTLAGLTLLGLTPVAAHAQDRDVTIVLNESVDVVEPCMAERQNVGRVIRQNVTETLVEYDFKNGGLMPRLATEWEATDENTWRFKLREGVKFHDGGDFTADDVIFTIERNLNSDLACETGGKFYGGLDFTFNKVDDHTLEISTEPAYPILPLLMAVTAIESKAATPADEFTRDPVGTGPYEFAEWNQGQSITLERYDGYWGEQPAVESATYVFRNDSAVAAAMVETGEADIVPSIALQDATNPDMDFAYPNSETTRLRIDTRTAPLDDKRVREALNYAIDREAMVGTLFSDKVEPATQLVVPTTMGYNKDLEVYPYDPEKAKELLAAAEADGVDVDKEIKIIGRTNQYANATEAMEAMAQMMREVGFNIDLQMLDVAVWNEYFRAPYADDVGPILTQSQHDNAMGDPVFTGFGKYHSKGTNSQIVDPELDALIEEATAAAGDEREKLWQQVFQKVNGDIVADVMMFHMVGFTRVNPRLKFEPTIATNSELQISQIGFAESN